jgi:hypothetical protein
MSHSVLDADGHVTESTEQVAKYQNQIGWASDFPHWDNSYPGSIDEIRDRGDISDAQKQKILADNCRRLYGI